MKKNIITLLLFLLPGSFLSQIAFGQYWPFATTTITVATTTDIFDVAGKTCPTVTVADLPGADGLISLREALCASNNTLDGNAHEITFQIGSGVQVIQPLSALPIITYPMTVDGTTQPDYPGTPVIVLDGSLAGAYAIGFWIRAGGSTIRGLNIQNFDSCAITIMDNGGNQIENNYLGVNTSGNQAQPNECGVGISDAPGNIIQNNLISGNLGSGVYIEHALASDNIVRGNRIGTDYSGTQALGNGEMGIYLANTPGNMIGGALIEDRNLISDNIIGVFIYGESANSNQVLGNFIGTDISGTQDLGNARQGIYITIGASNNLIGGSNPGKGNLVSGNDKDGIFIVNYLGGPGTSNNQVQGNKIGTDITGNHALGNTYCGIYVEHAPATLIGGDSPGAGNLISSNRCGIDLYLQPVGETWIQGNRIGANLNGDQTLGNYEYGIRVRDSQQVHIGGIAPNAGNLISGNEGEGILISGKQNWDIEVVGNLIGVDASCQTSLENAAGITIDGASDVRIGGDSDEERNIISGNRWDGIYIWYSDSIWVSGNLIGTGCDGQLALGNGGSGIFIHQSIDNKIGGTPQEGNTIAFNQYNGIDILGGELPGYGTSTGNEIRSNAIFDNQGLGIDLGNDSVTANDLNDPDTGPNALQNYPIITSARKQLLDGSVGIWYQLNSKPNSTFVLLFYASPSCNASGFGEGQQYLGGIEVVTAANGWYEFWLPTHFVLPVGWFVTGTATDANGNTSEFSACMPVTYWSVFYLPIIARK